MIQRLALRNAQVLRRCGFSTMSRVEGSLPASFYRGGTSKALIFQREHLPAERAAQDAIFLAAMGSPDPNGRQLDGMGGGYSSVSKVLIIGKSAHPDADVDYTFAQVLVDQPVVDYASNCGNMLAAVGPFALENGLVEPASLADGQNLVRIHNTNTKKIIHASFPVAAPKAANLSGDFAIDGVSGTHARITLDFVSPEGSRTGKLFPTGQVAEDLALPDGTSIPATLMDCGNPCVFVLASDLGVDPHILPPELEAHDGGRTLRRLDDIRNAAAVRMGLVPSLEAAAKAKSVPKVCIMSPKADNRILSGTLAADKIDVITRCISSGDPHRALPITASLCTAAAAQIDGTIVNRCLSGARVSQGVVIGHASGTIEVDADVAKGEDGQLHVPTARVFRTAKKLFEGNVFF